MIIKLGRRLGQSLAAALLAVALAAGAAGVALAHASLVRSDPPANTRLEQSPASVTVWFDEQVEPDYAHLSVYDASGQRVDRLDARFSPGAQPSIRATLPDLPAGAYVVVWRVVDVDDGHAVGGAFAFGVRASPDPKAAVAAGAQADAQPDLTSHLIGFLSLLGQLVLFGAVVFRTVIWRPVLAAAPGDEAQALADEHRRWLQVLADVMVGVLITGALGALYVQARSTGVVFWQLFATRWGAVWLVRAGLVFLACLWMELLLDGRRTAWAWCLSLALLATSAATSHSAAATGAPGAMVDFVHQAAAAVWVGGVLMLTLTLLALRRSGVSARWKAPLAANSVARFGGLAAVGVGVLLSTGLLLGWQQVQSWSGLLLTDYGRTLAVKLVLVLAALGLGAYNSLSAPRATAAALNDRTPGWIALEAIVAAAVIFAAAAMSDLPTAVAAGTAGASVAGETQAPLAVSTSSQGWRFDLRATPGRIGSNVFEVAVTPPSGQSAEGAGAVLQFAPLGGGPTSALPLASTRPGLFTGTGGGLNRTGAWQLRVTLQPAGGGSGVSVAYAVSVGLDGAVRPADEPLPWAVRAVAWLNDNGRAALTVALLLFAGAWTWIASRSRRGLERIGWMAAGLLAAVAVITTVVLIG